MQKFYLALFFAATTTPSVVGHCQPTAVAAADVAVFETIAAENIQPEHGNEPDFVGCVTMKEVRRGNILKLEDVLCVEGRYAELER